MVIMETSTITPQTKRHSFTKFLITISLQLLLWSSLLSLSIQISFFALSEVDSSLFLADVLCIAAAGTSLLFIAIHLIIVQLQESVVSKWAEVTATILKVIIWFASCVAVLLWITTVGLGVIFSLARQPTCRPANANTPDMWRKGRVCVLQRIALMTSMLSFIVSFILCFTYNISQDPFTAGLFGSTQKSVYLSSPDLERNTPMVKRHSTFSFKCRSALLAPIATSSPLRISSPLRMATSGNEEKPTGLGISSPNTSIERSPLLSRRTPSLSSTRSNGTVESLNRQPSVAYVPSSRIPSTCVPSPHGTHLYSPRHLPKAILDAAPGHTLPANVKLSDSPLRAPADMRQTQTTSLYTSRRVSSTFMTPSPSMATRPAVRYPSSRDLDTFPTSPPVHMPLTRPTNLYSTRRAPTPYTPYKPSNETSPPRRFPVVYTPQTQSSRLPSTLLAPPPSFRQLNSIRRGVSTASVSSSVYSRNVYDD